MRRREFITLLSGAVSWPFTARSQPALPVIGFLGGGSPDEFAGRLVAFRQGVAEAGYIEGRDVTIEYRWTMDQNDRLPAFAADLVQRRVTVIAATTTPSALAAKGATTSIPIVFVTAADPVALGLVGSLNRPGSNVTGVTFLSVELGPKRVELLHDVVPAVNSMALLVNPTNPSQTQALSKAAQAAASALGLRLHVVQASTERDIDAAFAGLPQLRVGGLVISPDIFFSVRSAKLAALAAQHAMPAIYQERAFAAAGGLMSYGGSIADAYRLFGVYAGRMLKDGNPADIPVQRSTKVELFINLKTAKALGLTVPLPILGRADEVIE